MLLHLAVYDPAHPSPSGIYWVWHAPELPLDMLNNFYYDSIQKSLPTMPNDLSPRDLSAGCASVNKTWCCWYRVFNGGRDLHGRPGRFVILAAFVRRTELRGRDASGILESPVFQRWADAIPMAPLVTPDDKYMTSEFAGNREAGSVLSDPRLQAVLKLEGTHALRELGARVAQLAADDEFQASISRKNGATVITLEVGSRAQEVIYDATPLRIDQPPIEHLRYLPPSSIPPSVAPPQNAPLPSVPMLMTHAPSPAGPSLPSLPSVPSVRGAPPQSGVHAPALVEIDKRVQVALALGLAIGFCLGIIALYLVNYLQAKISGQ